MSEDKKIDFSSLNLDRPEEVVAFVKDKWENRTQRRQNLEKQWYINVAYYMGFQYLVWDANDKRLALPNAPSWRVRLVVNKLQVIVRRQVAKYLKQKPVWHTIPATTDEDDILRAKTSTSVLRYYWRLRNINQVLVDVFTWTGCTGNAFLRPYWDPSLGPEMEIKPEDLSGEYGEDQQSMFQKGMEKLQAIFGKRPEGELEGMATHQGDLDYEVAPPFMIDPDPQAKFMDRCAFVIETRNKSPADIKRQYGKDVQPDSSSDSNLTNYYLDRISTFSGPANTNSYGDYTRSEDKDSVVEHTLLIKPGKGNTKNGSSSKVQYICVAGGQFLKRGEIDLPEIPLAHFKEIHVPARFWGTCALEQCMHLQLEYNRCRSQLIENRNLMSKPKWLNPKGSGVLNTSFTSEPGEVIEYNWPYKPEQVAVSPVPEYVHKTLEYAIRDFDDVSAQHEPSQAKVPQGARSGIAIAQLQEQDDTMYGPTLLVAEAALGKVGSWSLRLLSKNVSEERLIKIAGESKEIEVLTFKGADLIGSANDKVGVNYFDVEVQLGSQLPLSRAARIEFIIQLVQYGILNPELHRQQIFEMLQIGSEEPLMHESQLDRNQVFRENIQLFQGADLEINPWDNDEFHILNHRRFEKRAEFEKQLVMDPMLAMRFEQHITLHVNRLAEAESLQQIPPQEGGQQRQIEAPPDERSVNVSDLVNAAILK